jgi:DNA-binding transcriptional MerR regulator
MSAVYAGVMKKIGPFTIDELVEATGFDKRTIAYYVQEGLLPRVGRRGRLTRYPQSFANRLLVIKHLRQAEETGERPIPMTLAEIREALDRIPTTELEAMAAGAIPISQIDSDTEAPGDDLDGILPPPPEDGLLPAGKAPPEMATSEARMNLMLEETGEPDLFVPSRLTPSRSSEEDFSVAEGLMACRTREPAFPTEEIHGCSGPPPDRNDEIAQLAELLRDLARTTATSGRSRGLSQTRTNATITPGLDLSAVELDENSRLLLERAARLLRKITTGEGR